MRDLEEYEQIKESKRKAPSADQAKDAPLNNNNINNNYITKGQVIELQSEKRRERYIIPQPWWIDNDGAIQKSVLDQKGNVKYDVKVSHVPVFIKEKYLNLTDKTIGLVVEWRTNSGRWQEIKLSRDHFMITNKIAELSSQGFPVSSVNAKQLVQYLAEFEAANGDHIPLTLGSEQNGWTNNGFLIGNTFINSKGDELHSGDAGAVSFIATDSGDEQIVNGLTTSGTLEAQLDQIARIKDFHRVIAGIYTSIASPLLKIIDAPPFIHEWAAETSQGKTIAERLAAAVWGDPSKLIKSWNVTAVALERRTATLNHIPVFMDDTKDQPKKSIIDGFVYQHSQGMGRMRGTPHGTQKVSYWQNTLFSTGESKIVDYQKSGGSAARAISIAAPPFEGAANSYDLVTEITYNTADHHGHIGKEFIKYLIQNKERWTDYKAFYRQKRKEYANKAKGQESNVGIRLAENIAVLHTAAALFQNCFNLDWGFETLDKLLTEVLKDNVTHDRPKQALEEVISWVEVNHPKFITSTQINGQDNVPSGELWGKNLDNDDLFIFPTILTEFLSKQQHEPNAIVKSWNARGWLVAEKGRVQGKKNVNGKRPRGFVIKRTIINELKNS